MSIEKPAQLASLVDTDDFTAVAAEAKRFYSFHYSLSTYNPIEKRHKAVVRLFAGDFAGYKACNTPYHDLRHTIHVFLTAARLLDGYMLKHPQEKLPHKLALRVLTSALLHDIGYVQEESDTEGTGAVYTANHVQRGISMIRQHRQTLGVGADDLAYITRFILSTNLAERFDKIPFQSRQETTGAAIAASADLLGQMADREYLERLLFLYYEFKEAGIPGYDTEYDIIRQTKDFYALALRRFRVTLVNTYRYATPHFRERFHINRNLYMTAIHRHIAYVDRIIQDDTTNFRAKLNRNNFMAGT